MPSNKKGNRKADDWENDLGETPDSAVTVPPTENGEGGKDADEEIMAGGLMAALRKNKKKKAKKAGEDHAAPDVPDALDSIAAKAPEEASTEDLFGAQTTKGKGGKGKQSKITEKPVEEDDDNAGGDAGGLKSKKEKEKEKREREKQRKKEQVWPLIQI